MSLFTRATKHRRFLRMAIAGPSGSGKTFTALTIAQALSPRIAVIDTEHGGAQYYADLFDFDTLELTSFHPQRYMDAIQAAAREGYGVAVVDSLSHAWNGKEGILALKEQVVAQRKGDNDFTAWGKVTPLQNQLVETLLSVPLHVIVTMRSKMAYVLEVNEKGKQAPKKVGLAPIQREGLEYEFDLVAEMDQDHRLLVTKSRIQEVADLVVERPDATFAGLLHEALSAPPPPASTADARRQDDTQEGGRGGPAQHALVEEVREGCRAVIRPLKHHGLLKAVLFHSFSVEPEDMSGLPLDALERGIGLFRYLCTCLGSLGPGMFAAHPDAWVRARLQELATPPAQDPDMAHDQGPPEEDAGATGPSWGPESPDLLAREEMEAACAKEGA